MADSGPMDRLWVVMDHILWSVHQTITPQKPSIPVLEKNLSASWMRVNYAGEVCAQALLLGAMCSAEKTENFEHFAVLMREEMQHLMWCKDRLNVLGSPSSLCMPLWAVGAFILALLNGMRGDDISWALIEETEVLVMRHLRESYRALQVVDPESAEIVAHMLVDEAAHAATAHQAVAHRIRTGIMPMMLPLFHVMKQVEM